MDHCPTKDSLIFPIFQIRVLLCIIMLKKDSCKAAVMGKTSFIFSDSRISWRN